MLSRLASSVIVATALVFAGGEGAAVADEPGGPVVAPALPAPPALPPPAPAAHGALVVAIADGVGPAARALAFDVYRDAELRPGIDDATARVLAGDDAPEGAPARLKEIAELRVSILHAGSELVARRLLASLGTELGAALVVSVGGSAVSPVARMLRPGAVAFESVQLVATIEQTPAGHDGGHPQTPGPREFHWSSATDTLRRFLPSPPASVTPTGAAPVGPIPVATPPGPLAPRAEAANAPPEPTEPRPFYKSPWFWGSVAGAAAVGLSVFAISRATASGTTDVHLSGKVGP